MNLTPREREVCALLPSGVPIKEIARTLGLPLGTVKSLLHRSYDKLGVGNRDEAVAVMARRMN